MNYALDSPINRKVYIPEEDEVPFSPVIQPKNTGETDQTHRNMKWLFHKPQAQISTRPEETRNNKSNNFINGSKGK